MPEVSEIELKSEKFSSSNKNGILGRFEIPLKIIDTQDLVEGAS